MFDDLISRQAAIDALEKDIRMAKSEDGELWVAKINAQMKLTMLPGIESKHGKWIKHDLYIECPSCHRKWNSNYNDIYAFNYCPNCGSRNEMEE